MTKDRDKEVNKQKRNKYRKNSRCNCGCVSQMTTNLPIYQKKVRKII